MATSTVDWLPPNGYPRMDIQAKWPEARASYDGPWPQTTADFEQLADAYLDRLVQFAERRVGNRQDAEDVVQNVLAAGFRDRRKHKGVQAVGPYLYRAVANACVDVLRRRNCAAVFREELDVETLLFGVDPTAELAAATDEWQRADRLLARLPKEQADAVRLRVFDELRLSEIAELVGCSVNTVCSRLRYAFRKLRDSLAEGKE